jgi:hypothetical protein
VGLNLQGPSLDSLASLVGSTPPPAPLDVSISNPLNITTHCLQQQRQILFKTSILNLYRRHDIRGIQIMDRALDDVISDRQVDASIPINSEVKLTL